MRAGRGREGELDPLLDAVRPAKRHAEKAYEFDHCRDACRTWGIPPRIARRGTESSEKLGRHR